MKIKCGMGGFLIRLRASENAQSCDGDAVDAATGVAVAVAFDSDPSPRSRDERRVFAVL